MNFFYTTSVHSAIAQRVIKLAFLGCLMTSSLVSNATELTLKQAVESAISQDIWRNGNLAKQQARLAQGEAVATLADPKLSFALANVPGSNFDLNSEPMTQIQLGIAQSFERGDELDIKRLKSQLAAQQHDILERQRHLVLTRDVSLVWLDAYQAQQTIKLIEENQAIFQQLLEISQAGYASALGKSRQQDVIQAELELAQLEDKRLVYEQKLNTSKAKFRQWLKVNNTEVNGHDEDLKFVSLETARSTFTMSLEENKVWPWHQLLAYHPKVLLVGKQQQIAEQQIALEEQKYRPKWGLKGSYGFRQDSDNGAERADLFTVGLSVELPLFSAQRQDQSLKAAKLNASSIETDKQLLIRELAAQAQMQLQKIIGLQSRLALYENELLPQVQDQAEVLLSAYTHDDGDFYAVTRARILELNTKILALKIKTDLHKAIAQFNYFVSPQMAN